MKEQSVVIYAFSAKSIETVLDSGVMKNVNVVGVRTDEVVMGAPAIRGIPIIREFDNESLVVLLNENVSEPDRSIIEGKGLKTCKLDEFLALLNESEQDVSPDIPDTDLNDTTSEDLPVVVETEDSTDVVSEVSSDQEMPEMIEQTAPCFSDEQAYAIRGTLTTWLEKIYLAINNTKNKDTSIYNINKELQKFKDGYYAKLTSPIISEMITLREDYKKSIADYSKFDLNCQKQASYLECTVDQIDELLATYDVKVSDGKYSYNGKIIYPLDNSESTELKQLEGEFADIPKETYVLSEDVNQVTDSASLESFLERTTATVESLLQNNEALIKSIEIQNSDLKKQMTVTDGLLIIPLLRKIIRMRSIFSSKRMILDDFAEKSGEIYNEAYECGIAYTEKILESLGVSVRSNIDDIYDPKYHRILKMQKISPEEAEKDKRIAEFVTDCYINDERVIAPAKIIVYKL